MLLQTENLSFTVDENGKGAGFIITGKEDAAVRTSDYFRLILDDGLRTEIPIMSSKQTGVAKMVGDKMVITYDKLVSEYGDTYDVKFTVTVEIENGMLKFTPAVKNNTKDVRINECFCPLADFNELYGEEKDDVVYFPNGLGTRVENPWKFMKDMTSVWYQHDEYEIFWHYHYPRATMGWFGIESNGHFLYVGRHDEKARHCFMTMKQRIHAEPLNLMVGIDHFPMARPGEELEMPPTVLGILDGDWRAGADFYRAWADKTFFKVTKKHDWVKKMVGWQRIIMRSQYGEDYYKASDLPKIYEEGAKRGIHTIFLFAWWKEGMDRNYPTYEEPYPGAFKELSDNIKKVQDMGGHIILECNCHFLDPNNPYYKEFGDEVKIIDINGNEIRPAFVYPGRGEFRATYGKHQFPICCSGTERWRNQVLSQLKQMGDLGADCVFADCFCGCPYQPCFNDRHEHGARVDKEWVGHRKFFESAVEYCDSADKVFAGEVVTDVAAAYTQFIHGLVNVDFAIKSNQFPALFRYTFPEVITTERGIRDAEGSSPKQMRAALTTGVRLDCELYVCRRDIGCDEGYAKMCEEYAHYMNKYSEFYFDGLFTVIDTTKLPYYVKRGEFYNADKTKVLRVLYNASNDVVDACGVTLDGDSLRFDVFDVNEYKK
ncbi:MAG: hypothetical protein IJN48_00360 [Clostridia bacterium]|nr:hypothetical protein [Clostridia bacterium]